MNKHANMVTVTFSAVFMDMKLKGSLSHASINVPVSKLKKKLKKEHQGRISHLLVSCSVDKNKSGKGEI